MRFERLQLTNFKCYADADLSLDRGVSVIHGLNGSGKSTLLEACFFALYGSTALQGTLEDVITKGAEDMELRLWFRYGGRSYQVDRRIRLSGDRAQTARCTLDTDERTIDGARDVAAHITNLLHMDADAFVNCAYVRQGEVNKLIHATPAERQDMIDELLQLGKLETYRERMREARLGVGDVRNEVRGTLGELETQIEAKEDKDLPGRLNRLETELGELGSERDRLEAQKTQAEETRDEARELLESFEEKQSERESLAAEIDDLRSTVEETEAERDRLASTIGEHRESIETLAERRDRLATALDLDDPDPTRLEDVTEGLESTLSELRDELREVSLAKQRAKSEGDSLREAADELDSRAESAREEADGLEAELETDEAALDERRERIAELRAERADIREAFADALVSPDGAEDHLEDRRDGRSALEARRTELRTQLEAAREAVADAERLLEAGKCPECGQPVDDSPHVDALSDRRERVAELESTLETVEEELSTVEAEVEAAETLVEKASELERVADRIETSEELVAERATSLDEKRERISTLRERAEEHESTAEAKRETARKNDGRVERAQERLGELDERRGDVEGRLDELADLSAVIDEIDDVRDEISSIRERREQLAELNEERRERLSEKRERKRALDEDFDPDRVERAEADRDRAEQYLEQVTDVLSELDEREAELRDAIGGVRGELNELEALRERRESIERRMRALESLYSETQDLQELYGRLRADLRRRNVDVLERMLNETFDLVYQNDSYARIELTGDYELTVYQKDGESLDPDQLSGGERALFNLSLRCAIYRLLAEGIDGASPMPPLILDEPTVFLDDGHVAQLVELVDSMRGLGVEQIVVVSHDDELVNAAEDLITVEKDPTTNRSSISRDRPVPETAALEALEPSSE